MPEQTVLVKGDCIAAIEKFGKLKLPGSAKVIDGRGKYMIPALWDMHVHARGTPALLSDNESWLTLYIANGITGVREMGGDYVDTVFRWRAETAKGERLGPRILSSGPKVEGPKPKLPGSFAITLANCGPMGQWKRVRLRIWSCSLPILWKISETHRRSIPWY